MKHYGPDIDDGVLIEYPFECDRNLEKILIARDDAAGDKVVEKWKLLLIMHDFVLQNSRQTKNNHCHFARETWYTIDKM